MVPSAPCHEALVGLSCKMFELETYTFRHYQEPYGSCRKFLCNFGMIGPPCASPLRALARVRISAYPVHRMQNYKDFCILQSKSYFLKNRNRNARNYVAWLFAVIGGSATIRPRFTFEGLGWTGGTCPGTISLLRVLRGSCARGSFGQTRYPHKTLYSGC